MRMRSPYIGNRRAHFPLVLLRFRRAQLQHPLAHALLRRLLPLLLFIIVIVKHERLERRGGR